MTKTYLYRSLFCCWTTQYTRQRKDTITNDNMYAEEYY